MKNLLHNVATGHNELAIENYLTTGMGIGRVAAPPSPSPLPTPVLTRQSEEAIFTSPDDSCAVAAHGPAGVLFAGDTSDAAPRMFIDEKHQYQLVTGANVYFQMKADSFDALTRDCAKPTLLVDPDREYSKGRSLDWIEAVYTKNGKNVFGISANDWHGTYWYYPECFVYDANGKLVVLDGKCWWGTLVGLVSGDGGGSFSTVSANPLDYIIAQPPPDANKNPVNGKNFGYFGISNIMKNPFDGAYYYFANVSGIGPVQPPPPAAKLPDPSIGSCLFRAAADADLSSPASWLGYDPDKGSFNTLTGPPQNELCKPISFKAGTIRHLSWNTFYQEFLILFHGKDGVYYSISINKDLTKWRAPVLLYASPAVRPGVDGSFYPTLIDHSYELLARPFADRSERRNFDITGSSPHLYLVRFEKGKRMLNRLQVRFKALP